jgi:hypothetical protein
MFRHVLWKGQLNEDAVHRGVIVGLGDFLKELGFDGRLREVDDLADDAGLD